VAKLQAEERRRRRGLDDGAEGPAGVGGEARGHVDGDDGRRARVHRRDERGGGTFDRAVEASAEERVDHDVRCRERQARGCGRTRPAGEGGRGVAAETGRVAVEEDAHRATGVGEEARSDKAVAAVVAGAGDDEDPPLGDEAGGDLGDRAAGGFHEVDAGDAAGDGAAVGLGHLGGGEELVHGRDYGTRRAEW
jgi:hypothetical protein